ncbi:hypothetical protein AN958_11620 [Leucoagaricus sp. SymC.cos]|nr:hypothetical protein AN958_11620 [Leucoagaricus sp. SymC.cos]
MLFLALLVTLLHLVFSVQTTTSPVDILDPPGPTIPLTIFSRELPECVNPARCRTLQGIIWSCLATIFACTWVSMHPNVPDPRWSGFRRLWERIALMFYAVIAPEIMVVWAFRQRMMAFKWANEYNEHRQKFDLAWTLTHGFLFEMQGLVYLIDGKPSKPPGERKKGYHDADPIGDVGREEIINHPSQIRRRFIISEEEINDKSKGDAFTKLLVVLQTSWFIIQCIARWAAHLHVTELEIVTLAFAFLNIITYVVWWNKPQNMGVAIRVQEVSAPPPQQHDGPDHGTSEDDADESTTLASDAEDRTGVSFPDHDESGSSSDSGEKWKWSRKSTLTFFKRGIVLVGEETLEFLLSLPQMLGNVDIFISAESKVRFYSSEHDGTENGQVALMAGVIGVLFGGVHLIPFWLSSFPSVWQKYLWLASGSFIVVGPVIVTGSTYIIGFVKNKVVYCMIMYLAFIPAYAVGFFFYIVGRLIFYFLAFDTLRFLPPDAFANVEWSTFFPHI